MAGLKLFMCLALIAPALSQVFNGQRFAQGQQRFGTRQFGMGRAAGMADMGEYMDTRSDMISDAMERRGSMAQSVLRSQRVGLGATQRPNGMNYNNQYNVYQAPNVQARAQPYQLVNAIPSNTVYLQAVPSGQFMPASQMAVAPQIINAPQIIRTRQVAGAPQVMGTQQMLSAPQQMLSAPQQMISAPQMVAAPRARATQQIAATRQPVATQQPVASQNPVSVQAPQPQANGAAQAQSLPNVTTQTAGNIPANQVIEMLKQMFTTTGNNTGARKFVIV